MDANRAVYRTWNSVADRPRLQHGRASAHLTSTSRAAFFSISAVGPGAGARGMAVERLFPAGAFFCLQAGPGSKVCRKRGGGSRHRAENEGWPSYVGIAGFADYLFILGFWSSNPTQVWLACQLYTLGCHPDEFPGMSPCCKNGRAYFKPDGPILSLLYGCY